jgi:hypothetical protein
LSYKLIGMEESGVLHFYTTGEAYMDLIKDFYKSGLFYQVEQLLGDGNFQEHQKYLAFRLMFTLAGDTRKGDLMASFLTEEPEDFNEILYYSILTSLHSINYEYDVRDIEHFIGKGHKNIDVLMRYFTLDEIFSRCKYYILREYGYRKSTLYDVINANDNTISGMLLQDGSFIQCGYQDHVSLFPVLAKLGLVDGDDRFNCDAIAISSSMLSGGIGYSLETMNFRHEGEYKISEEQLEQLWDVREHHLRHYSGMGRNPINDAIRGCYVHGVGKGGKYGNLKFMQKFYPHIKICEFSEEYEKSYGVNFVRTSPERSMPGLLNSIIVKNKKEADAAVEKIKEDYEKIKTLKQYNELSWFYQKWEPGQNGVLNCTENPRGSYPDKLSPEQVAIYKYNIEIACSEIQGDIVGGKKSSYELSPDEKSYLRGVAREIASDMGRDIQMEFVRVAENDIRIVQLRTLGNSPSKSFDYNEEDLKDAIVRGKSFSHYDYSSSSVEVKDILVVEEDAKSEDLIGKKALIVENDVSFSHILALSKALNINSMYATGKVDFGDAKEVIFKTDRKTSYIKKIS